MNKNILQNWNNKGIFSGIFKFGDVIPAFKKVIFWQNKLHTCQYLSNYI